MPCPLRIAPLAMLAALAGCVESTTVARREPCRLPCGPSLPTTLARFDFEALPAVDDLTGGPAPRREGTLEAVEGPTGCGQGVHFGDGGYLVVDDDARWDEPLVTLSFYFLPMDCGVGSGISASTLTSRDALNREFPGHLTVAWEGSCRVYARLQVSTQGRGDLVIRSEQLEPGQWVHVTAVAGPPTFELWIDGELAGTEDTDTGIEGNANPWVLGGATHESADGSEIPVNQFATGVFFDAWRIDAGRLRFCPELD